LDTAVAMVRMVSFFPIRSASRPSHISVKVVMEESRIVLLLYPPDVTSTLLARAEDAVLFAIELVLLETLFSLSKDFLSAFRFVVSAALLVLQVAMYFMESSS
jgi:hypothetical protein